MRKTFLWASLCAACVVGIGASAALAGEVNGNGQPVKATTVSHSICAFSGQNDNPTSTESGEPRRRGAVLRLQLREQGLQGRSHEPGRGLQRPQRLAREPARRLIEPSMGDTAVE